MKIAQFLQAGCNVKILLADVHGFLDNLKAPIELVEYRAKYYRYCITALLRAVNVPIDKLEFVLGSSYQMSPVCLALGGDWIESRTDENDYGRNMLWMCTDWLPLSRHMVSPLSPDIQHYCLTLMACRCQKSRCRSRQTSRQPRNQWSNLPHPPSPRRRSPRRARAVRRRGPAQNLRPGHGIPPQTWLPPTRPPDEPHGARSHRREDVSQ